MVTVRNDGTTSRTPAIAARWMASARAIACAFTAASMRSSNSTTSAESPAATVRILRERVEKAAMNAAEAAVRHHDDEIALPVLVDDGRHNRVERLRGTRRPGPRAQRADQLRQRQPLGF